MGVEWGENDAFKFGCCYLTVLFSVGFEHFPPTPSNFGSLSHHCQISSSLLLGVSTKRLSHRRSISSFISCNFFNSSENVMFRSMIPLSFLLASCGQGQHRNHLPTEILSQNPPEVNGVNSLFFDKKDSILGLGRFARV